MPCAPRNFVLTAQDIEAFWAQIFFTETCWIWTGQWAVSKRWQYGGMTIGGKAVLAHRVSYMVHHGSIPFDRPYICHACDVGLCVSPAHLWAGSHKENMRDKVAKRRSNIPAGDAWHAFHDGKMASGDNAAARRYPAIGEKLSAWRRANPDLIARGEDVGNAKLTEAKVREIRRRRAGGETMPSLAIAFGVSLSNINFIVKRLTWKQVT